MTFFSVNLTFFPQHALGLEGMPRRISDYPDGYYLNKFWSSLGSMMSSVCVLFFFFILWESLALQPLVIGFIWGSNARESMCITLPVKNHSLSEVSQIRF